MKIEDIVETGADLIEESTEKFLYYVSDTVESIEQYKEIVDILNDLFECDLDYTIYYTGNRSFEGFDRLQQFQVKVLDGTTYIPHRAFMNCAVTSVEIPDSVIKIESYAFYCCEKLQSARMPNSLQEIGEECFLNCRNLREIQLPSSLQRIDDKAFHACTFDLPVVIPSGCQLGEGVFMYCKGCNNITFPDDTYKIPAWTFYMSHDLDGIKLPTSIQEIGRACFIKTNLTGVIDLPNLRVIGDGAFQQTQITSIKLSDKCEFIGEHVFYNCEKLSGELYIPKSVKRIGDFAFGGRNYLSKVYLPRRFSRRKHLGVDNLEFY